MSARDEDILARFDAGEKYAAIAARFGLTPARIGQIAKANGRDLRRPFNPGNAVAREAARRWRGKKSARAIAAEVGCTRDAIIGHWFRLRQQGLIR